MEYTPPTRMESPNPASHVDRYYMRRVITDNQIELHWHNFFEIDFMDDGRGMHRLNGVERPFTRGTLGDAARIAGYSEDYFGRLFKQQYGCAKRKSNTRHTRPCQSAGARIFCK